jgi:hypothetical protein
MRDFSYSGTDFTDSEFSIHAAHRMKLAQKLTKATKKKSSFVSFVLFCSRGIRLIRTTLRKNHAIPRRFLPQRNAKNSRRTTYDVSSLRSSRSHAASPLLVTASPFRETRRSGSFFGTPAAFQCALNRLERGASPFNTRSPLVAPASFNAASFRAPRFRVACPAVGLAKADHSAFPGRLSAQRGAGTVEPGEGVRAHASSFYAMLFFRGDKPTARLFMNNIMAAVNQPANGQPAFVGFGYRRHRGKFPQRNAAVK